MMKLVQQRIMASSCQRPLAYMGGGKQLLKQQSRSMVRLTKMRISLGMLQQCSKKHTQKHTQKHTHTHSFSSSHRGDLLSCMIHMSLFISFG